MATKVVYTVREDKRRLQKQLGCMNGVFHLLNRGYLLGLHRHWRNQNKLTTDHGEKELKKSSEKAKEKRQKKTMMMEKNRAFVESSRNSCSSSCSSTTLSSFECSKQVQTESQLAYEPTSPNLHKKKPEWSQPSPDIRDVVKDSMTRVNRVTKNERAGFVIMQVDSSKPFIHQNSIQYERKDQNLEKIQKISSASNQVNETSRFSCDERISQYSLESSFKVKEIPRLSLDSKQNAKTSSMNESRSEPVYSKKPSSGIVARLMGLDSLIDSNFEAEKVKMIKPDFGDQLGSNSPTVHAKIKPVLQQQERGDQLGSLTVNSASSPTRREPPNRHVKPAKMATEPVMVTGLRYVNRKAKKELKDQTPMNNKAIGRTPTISSSVPRLQKSKNGIDKQSLNGSLSDSSKIKKQSSLKTKKMKIKPIDPMQNNDQSCMMHSNETRNISEDRNTINFNKHDQVTRNNFAERLIEDKPMVELTKLTMQQASPVSVLDAFHMEDIPSPIMKKSNAFDDYDNFCVHETEWNQMGTYNLETSTDEFSQIELLNSIDDERPKSPCKITNGDHKYIRDILSSSGFLLDPDSVFKIYQIHPTDSIINPELFNILEKTNDKCYNNNPSCKSNEKVRRKFIFDSVNDILVHKLARFSEKRYERFVDGEKLLNELWFELDHLQSGYDRCIYDEDDEVKILVTADLYKNSQDWDKYGYEVHVVVLDIERLIFKDLIDEIVNIGVQDRLGRHCKRLFTM